MADFVVGVLALRSNEPHRGLKVPFGIGENVHTVVVRVVVPWLSRQPEAVTLPPAPGLNSLR
jgi:hypothetical protein